MKKGEIMVGVQNKFEKSYVQYHKYHNTKMKLVRSVYKRVINKDCGLNTTLVCSVIINIMVVMDSTLLHTLTLAFLASSSDTRSTLPSCAAR